MFKKWAEPIANRDEAIDRIVELLQVVAEGQESLHKRYSDTGRAGTGPLTEEMRDRLRIEVSEIVDGLTCHN